MTGDNLVSYEVRRMGIETGPLIFASIALMIIFVVLTSFRFILKLITKAFIDTVFYQKNNFLE